MSRLRTEEYLPIVRAELEVIPLPWKDSDWRILCQMQRESSGDPYAISHVGALGLMQVMPATAIDEMERLAEDPETYQPFHPRKSIRYGLSHMRWVASRFETRAQNVDEWWKLCLLAYNTGAGRVSGSMKTVRNMPYQVWLDEGMPDGRWRTADGIHEEIVNRLEGKTPDPEEPIKYQHRIEALFKDLELGGQRG